MRYCYWTEKEIAGLSSPEGIAKLYIEVDNEGVVRRELGVNSKDKIIHRCPSDFYRYGIYGLFDNQKIQLSEVSPTILKEEFENLWKRPNHIMIITSALPMELSGIRALDRFRKQSLKSGPKYHVGNIRGKDVALLVSGIGEEKAYETAKAVCETLKPEAYIAVGLSAALREGLHAGAIVVGDSVISPEGSPVYQSDAALVASAREALKDYAVFAPLTTFRKVVCRSMEKRMIAANSGAAALDMESFGAARACAEAGVPFIAVRAISDSLDEDLPVDFNRFTKNGRMCWPRFLLYLVTHPKKIRPLMRLGKNSRLAAKNLALMVEKVVGNFPL